VMDVVQVCAADPPSAINSFARGPSELKNLLK